MYIIVFVIGAVFLAVLGFIFLVALYGWVADHRAARRVRLEQEQAAWRQRRETTPCRSRTVTRPERWVYRTKKTTTTYKPEEP